MRRSLKSNLSVLFAIELVISIKGKGALEGAAIGFKGEGNRPPALKCSVISLH